MRSKFSSTTYISDKSTNTNSAKSKFTGTAYIDDRGQVSNTHLIDKSNFNSNSYIPNTHDGAVIDEILKFRLDHKTAASVAVTTKDGVATVNLLSAAGDIISTSEFSLVEGQGELRTVELDPQEQVLVFTFISGDHIYCDLSALYQKIELIASQKQDKLIAGKNITIEGNVISATGSEPIEGHYVRYDTDSQGLTLTEKRNARLNIGAGTSSFSGNYNDLANKPIIPTKTSDLINDSDFITGPEVDTKIANLPRDCFVTSTLDDIGIVMNTGSIVYLLDDVSLKFQQTQETVPKNYYELNLESNNVATEHNSSVTSTASMALSIDVSSNTYVELSLENNNVGTTESSSLAIDYANINKPEVILTLADTTAINKANTDVLRLDETHKEYQNQVELSLGAPQSASTSSALKIDESSKNIVELSLGSTK